MALTTRGWLLFFLLVNERFVRLFFHSPFRPLQSLYMLFTLGVKQCHAELWLFDGRDRDSAARTRSSSAFSGGHADFKSGAASSPFSPSVSSGSSPGWSERCRLHPSVARWRWPRNAHWISLNGSFFDHYRGEVCMCVSVSVFAMYTFDFTQNLSSLNYTRRMPLWFWSKIFAHFLYFFVDVRQRESRTVDGFHTWTSYFISSPPFFYFVPFYFLISLFFILILFVLGSLFFLSFYLFAIFFSFAVFSLRLWWPFVLYCLFALCGLGSSLLCHGFCFFFTGPFCFLFFIVV